MDEHASHLRQSDAFTFWMEADPLLRSTIIAVSILDRSPDWETLQHRMERASRLAPGFRDKLVEVPLKLSTPRWVTDPDFDLSFHLRRVRVASPGRLEDVFDLARTMGMAGFDTARPLWEATLVEGMEDGRAAFVMKVHHALTDGIGGMQLALFLYDLERDADQPQDLPPAPDGEHLEAIDLLREALGHDLENLTSTAARAARSALPALTHAMFHPRTTVSGLLSTLASVGRFVAPVSETLSPVMTDRKLAWHYQALDVPVAALKRAATAAGGTLNDGFLAGVTGGMRLYHEHHGSTVDELRVTMPVSLRRDSDPVGGNRITIMRFVVPVGEPDPAVRIGLLHDLALQVRNEPAIDHTDTIAGGLDMVPRGYIGGMLKHVDFLASNVPGFREPIYLAGAEVTRLYALGPTIGSSANLTLLSYRDTSCVGVTTDTGAITDPEVFLTCLQAGFEEVLDLAGPHREVGVAT